MRMIVVTIITLAGILATLITGITIQAVTVTFMSAMPLSENIRAEGTYDFLFGLVENTQIIWVSIIGAIIGLIIWWVASSQQREAVTGVYS